MHWSPAGLGQRWSADDLGLRTGLLKFIGDFANWDKAADATYLAAARALVKAAHPDETPLVVDPFAGGGSIPLEALRLGCDAFASDLNPVAVLINKVMLEDIPRYGKAKIKVKNAEARKWSRRAGRGAAHCRRGGEGRSGKGTGRVLPARPDGSRPIAYLWARTVRCEAPNCGAEIPLVRSFWLAKKANRKRALRYTSKRENGTDRRILKFEIFEPKNDKEVPDGTVSRARATCPCCNMVLSPERVRAQLAEQQWRGRCDFWIKMEQRSGGARLLAVVMLKPGSNGSTVSVRQRQ